MENCAQSLDGRVKDRLYGAMTTRSRDYRRDAGLIEAINAVGTLKAIADACSVTLQCVSGWTRVPPEHVIAVEAVSGVPRERLRPDLYGAPRPRPRRRAAAEAAA